MSLTTVCCYDSQGRLQGLDAGWFVYTAICPAYADRVLIKVGITGHPYNRLAQIHNNSPYPIEIAAFVPVGSKETALRVEREILAEFPDRLTRGEWIDLPASSGAQFRDSATQAFMRRMGTPPKWTKVSGEQIRAFASQQRSSKAKRRKGAA